MVKLKKISPYHLFMLTHNLLQGRSYIRGKTNAVPEKLANRFGWEMIDWRDHEIVYSKILKNS